MARIKHVSLKREPEIAMTTSQGGLPAPNALACGLLLQGMGGQHGYFGLWLDSDFGRGHSRARPKCTTYGSPQLSAEEDFSLDSVEVWAVGKPPEPEDVGHLHLIYFYTLPLSVSSQTLNLPHFPADFTIGAFFSLCLWGQGEEGVGKRSVLDMDPEVQAIMEMTGKTLHSQGLREPEEDQDD